MNSRAAWRSPRTAGASSSAPSGAPRLRRRRHAALDAAGPRVVWATNITADGRLVVAAADDGTLRWHRLDDGREVLALFPLADRRNWVAWTPEGIYAATPGAHGVLRWHVNRGWDAPAEAIRWRRFPRPTGPRPSASCSRRWTPPRHRPGGPGRDARRHPAAHRRRRGPGARLHVLTVGVSDYGQAATHLKLNFAAADATDVAAALLNTQKASTPTCTCNA